MSYVSKGDWICGRPPESKTRLLLCGQWVDDWFDTSADESLEDLEGTHSRYTGNGVPRVSRARGQRQFGRPHPVCSWQHRSEE